MARFHNSGTECTASFRACPLGLGEEGHIEANSIQEFQDKLVAKLSRQTTSTLSPEEAVIREAEMLVGDLWEAESISTNPEVEELSSEDVDSIHDFWKRFGNPWDQGRPPNV